MSNKKDKDSSFTKTDIVINDKSDDRQVISLNDDECAIIITDDVIKFLCNTIDHMNEIQVAAAGAVIALISPEWRSQLIDLVEDGIEEAYEEQLKKEQEYIEDMSDVSQNNDGLKKDSFIQEERKHQKEAMMSPFLDYDSLMKNKKSGKWGVN